ncbi:histidine triad nucleotide-binding protein [Oceanibacterium hippocampi]|uniref:HIT-like protein n=1 Tax=Oceanibacterium hippocampi TaxID=745714 RepID=A0A1Y5RIG7_9PROT|nr:histidine triad nucleotide-binding protein [Oceanibacterium hippocampi]SLN18381.1 HIT-like protein [Oceanibacterium hippocampi]
MAYDENNIFARILRGELPCNKVYEDDHALAFHDINPQAPVHVLVVPKGAYVDFDDFAHNASAEEQLGFTRAIGTVARQLGVVEQGFRLVTNNGAFAGQIVPHYHVHIFGGRKMAEGRMARGLKTD